MYVLCIFGHKTLILPGLSWEQKTMKAGFLEPAPRGRNLMVRELQYASPAQSCCQHIWQRCQPSCPNGIPFSQAPSSLCSSCISAASLGKSLNFLLGTLSGPFSGYKFLLNCFSRLNFIGQVVRQKEKQQLRQALR